MKKYRLRLPATFLVIILLFGTGVLGVYAAPPCERLIRKYTETILRHPFSQGTLSRWALWNKLHPNYHAPKKPRTRLTPQETFEKVTFDCEVPFPETPGVDDLLPPEIPPDFLAARDFIPANLLTPPGTPIISLINAPAIVAPADTEPTPEPSSILFLGTGMAILLWMTRKSARWARSQDARP